MISHIHVFVNRKISNYFCHSKKGTVLPYIYDTIKNRNLFFIHGFTLFFGNHFEYKTSKL